VLITTASAASLFFLLWWMLQAEEAPWVPAGLAASVLLLVAASARLMVTRRARVAPPRNFVSSDRHRPRSHSHSGSVMRSTSLHAAALRALQKQSVDADEKDVPEVHRELYEMCTEYLAGAEKALLSPALQPDGRIALRAGQDRVRDLQKHHLLTWARGSARTLTHEAQKRVRLYEKIETANRALDCIDSALKVFPDEEELNVSARAIREFITSSRVAHWVELAERAAFKGYHQRAIDCYKDALFYLTRDRASAAGEAAAERITREIDFLRAELNTAAAMDSSPASKSRPTRRRSN
jgi:tetratricopeptide (TPR) repeat protein